jgi:hypothetical protein
MNERASVWLGYTSTGGMFSLTRDDMKGGVCLLGQSSSDLAALVAYASSEAGLKTLVLDTNGFATRRISGSIQAYDPSYFLYDAMKMEEENPNFHAQLIGSAYSTALDLTYDQEALLGAVGQQLALEEGVASPLALAERMEGEDLSGNASKRLRGRLNSLSTLNVVGDQGVMAKLFSGSAILNFGTMMTPEISELAVALVIAKLLAVGSEEKHETPDVVVFLQANRLFRGRPIFRQNLRLLSTFVADPVAKVLSSDVRYGIDDRFLETAVVKIVSSDVWNDPRNTQILAPGTFAVRNSALGYEEVLIPRIIEYKTGAVVKGSAPQASDTGLARDILDTISTFGDSTRHSLFAYVSQGRSRDEVEKEVDRLLDEGYIQTASKKIRKDAPHSVLKLTAKGVDYLKGGK